VSAMVQLIQSKCQNDALFQHINKLVIERGGCSLFFTSWFVRVFFGRLPYSLSMRILDCIINEGLKVLFQVALALFSLHSERLLVCQSGVEIEEQLQRAMVHWHDDNLLMAVAFSFQLKRESLQDHLRAARDAILPSFDGLSTVCNWEQLATLWSWLPARYRIKEPRRLFCSSVNGFNLGTLVLKCGKTAPTIMIAKTKKGRVFGVFVSTEWQKSNEYRGSGEMFIFSLTPKMRKYPWTKDNSFFMRMENKSIMFGGGTGCALFLDDELFHGYSERTETFDNEPLNGSDGRDFECVEVEVFGFK